MLRGLTLDTKQMIEQDRSGLQTLNALNSLIQASAPLSERYLSLVHQKLLYKLFNPPPGSHNQTQISIYLVGKASICEKRRSKGFLLKKKSSRVFIASFHPFPPTSPSPLPPPEAPYVPKKSYAWGSSDEESHSRRGRGCLFHLRGRSDGRGRR